MLMSLLITRRESLVGLGTWFATSLLVSFFGVGKANGGKDNSEILGERSMKLPQAKTAGTVSLEKAIKNRRTIRSFQSKPLTLEQLAQLFWAAQGITIS